MPVLLSELRRRLGFLRALWDSVVIFTTEARRPQRVLWVGCGESRISFRAVRVAVQVFCRQGCPQNRQPGWLPYDRTGSWEKLSLGRTRDGVCQASVR